jgi:hypothetical protein
MLNSFLFVLKGLSTRYNYYPRVCTRINACKQPGDLTVSKRTGTSSRIEIQFRTFNHLSRPDYFVKLFETLCPCLAQGNECLGQI